MSDVDADAPRRAQLRAVGTAFLRQRPWIVGPALLVQGAVLAASGAPRRQVAAVLTGFSGLMAFFAWEAWRGRSALVTAAGLQRSLRITLAVLCVGAAATGGAHSPMLPVLFAPTVVGFAAFGRAREGNGLFIALGAALAALAALPAGVPFPTIPPEAARWMSLVASLTALTLLWVGVSSLSDAHARAGEELAQAGEELLAAAEARQAAMESLGAQVAHEIKNPLTAIKGLADLVAEQPADPRASRRLEVLGGEVARIEAILKDYLSFSRPFDVVRREAVDLAAVLRPVAALLEVRAERTGVTLHAEGEALGARVDPRRVKEAALNLCLNALDATPRGGAVRLAWTRGPDGAVITVEDSGAGMSPEVLARVGDAFFTTRAGGTGLGVRLARSVAAAHGGALTFDSAPGRGTVARLTLPEDS